LGNPRFRLEEGLKEIKRKDFSLRWNASEEKGPEKPRLNGAQGETKVKKTLAVALGKNG